MDKDTVLTHVLKSKDKWTLLGGELPVSVIKNDKYITPLTFETYVMDRYAEENFPPLDHAFTAALSDETKKVILTGPEGSGKTTALEKLVVDWAKGEHLHNFSYVFYYRLRELNALDGTLSLETLMLHHHGHIPPESMLLLLQKPEDVLFIFDDVDQCKQSLDPSVHTLCSDPGQSASLACLVASLLHGSLLKGAAFVLAARSPDCLNFLSGARVEMLGFLKPQREAYFNGFFTDPAAASKALMHMERTLGFYDVCTSPRFSWTVCSIYKFLMDAGAKLPETLSQLYVVILVHLIQALNEPCKAELVLVLGKMASRLFLDERLSCTKEEMDSFGFQQFPTSVEVFMRVDGDQSETPAISFHSKMMQEFLFAVSFFLEKSPSEDLEKMFKKRERHAKFIDAFLSALSEPIQRKPLETLLGELNSDRIVDFRRWFKSSSETQLQGIHREEHVHFFHMLHQAQNEGLVKEIITPSARLGLSYGQMSLQDCAALNYVMTCLGEMEQLNMYLCNTLTGEKAELLAPTMSLPHKIIFSSSFLSIAAVPHLASALSRGITEELDLSHTLLGDEKFKILCAGFKKSKLQNLKLGMCRLTAASCEDLASVLTSGTSQLRYVDIACNEIGDQGFMKLCKALHSPHCKLQELQLHSCGLTEASIVALSAALCSEKTELRKVDTTSNSIGFRGVEALCEAVQHPLCKLQRLNFYDSELTVESCPHLMKALMSEHCSLSELELSVNDLGQEGALLICQALRRPGCPLEKLGLQRCELTESVFKELGSVLQSGTSKLKSLSLGVNEVGDQGVKPIWEAVAHPNCQLEELDVEMTGLTDACVEDVCAAIRASKTLKSLEMRNNSLTDASVPALVQVMQDNPNMEELNLKYSEFSEDVFEMLDKCERIRY